MLCLKRLKNNYDNSFEYSVYIDDVCEGYIDDGKYLKLKVKEGTHRVKVLYDYGHSNEMSIVFHDAEGVNLICGLNADTYKDMLIPVYRMFKRKGNILFIEYETDTNLKLRKKMEISRKKYQIIYNIIYFVEGIAFWGILFGEGISRYISIVVFIVIFISCIVFRHFYVSK